MERKQYFRRAWVRYHRCDYPLPLPAVPCWHTEVFLMLISPGQWLLSVKGLLRCRSWAARGGPAPATRSCRTQTELVLSAPLTAASGEIKDHEALRPKCWSDRWPATCTHSSGPVGQQVMGRSSLWNTDDKDIEKHQYTLLAVTVLLNLLIGGLTAALNADSQILKCWSVMMKYFWASVQ